MRVIQLMAGTAVGPGSSGRWSGGTIGGSKACRSMIDSASSSWAAKLFGPVGSAAEHPVLQAGPAGQDPEVGEHPNPDVVRGQAQPRRDDLDELLAAGLVDGADHRFELRLVMQEGEEPLPALGQIGRDPEQGVAQQLVKRLPVRRIADRLRDVVEPALGHGRDTFGLAGEVVGEGPAGDPHRVGDVGDRDGGVAALDGEVHGRLGQRPPGRVLLAFPQARRVGSIRRRAVLCPDAHPTNVRRYLLNAQSFPSGIFWRGRGFIHPGIGHLQ